jgi:hypothetical protein
MFVLITLKNEKEISEKYFLYKKKNLELHQSLTNLAFLKMNHRVPF